MKPNGPLSLAHCQDEKMKRGPEFISIYLSRMKPTWKNYKNGLVLMLIIIANAHYPNIEMLPKIIHQVIIW